MRCRANNFTNSTRAGLQPDTLLRIRIDNQAMLDSGPPPGIAVPIEFAIERPGADPDSYELRLITTIESSGM